MILRRVFPAADKDKKQPENDNKPTEVNATLPGADYKPPAGFIYTAPVAKPAEKFHPVTIKTPEFSFKGPKDGTVYISSMAKRKLDLYTRHCDNEISGLGIVEIVDDMIIVQDIHILKQSVSSGSTDLNDDSVAEFMMQCIENDTLDKIKLWWHSHCNMGTFWSGTDTGTIEKFCNGWMISIVTNKKGDYLCRLDMYSPFRITIDEIPMKCIMIEDEFDDAIKEEIKEKVTSSYSYVTKYTKYNGTQQGSYWGKNWQMKAQDAKDQKKEDDPKSAEEDSNEFCYERMYF